MSKHEPTAEEQGIINERLQYEEACVNWSPGQTFPHPPKPQKFGWRPLFPADDPKVLEVMYRNYLAAGREYRGVGVFPARPRPYPGRVPRVDPATGTFVPPGRPRLFSPGTRTTMPLVVDTALLAELDQRAKQEKMSRSALIRLLLRKGLEQ